MSGFVSSVIGRLGVVFAVAAFGAACSTAGPELTTSAGGAESELVEPATPPEPALEAAVPSEAAEEDEVTDDGAESEAQSEEESGAEDVVSAAVSESGRSPAYGGGNPDISLTEALSVQMPTVSGEVIDVSQYLGQDVVLWFWAPWCSWCNAEAPRVKAAAEQFDGQVEIIGVAGVSDEESMALFVNRHELRDLTHLADLDGRFWRSLDVTYQPWWIFIDDSGQVVLNWQGRLSDEDLNRLLGDLAAA